MSAARKVRRAQGPAKKVMEKREARGVCPWCAGKVVEMSGPNDDGSFVTRCARGHRMKATP